MAPVSTQTIKEICLREGFDRVGISPAHLGDDIQQNFHQWIKEGYAGNMHYMAKNPGRRVNPELSLPDAKSVICLLIHYYQGENQTPKPDEGRIARYAWGRDYHKVIEKKLKNVTRKMIELCGPETHIKSYVDYGPILERSFAAQAGLGFIGKNTMLITPGLGSFTFLATLITNLELENDSPTTISCGTCTRCIEACPTDAIVSPHRIDANKCISYLTIELKPNEKVPDTIQPHMGDWLFGCDICQDVCPFNRKIPETRHPEFRQDAGVGAVLNLNDLLAMQTDGEFHKKLSGTPLMRAKRTGLQRSAAIALRNGERLQKSSRSPREEENRVTVL